MSINPVESSFRDPSGFLFWQDGHLFRQINSTYKENFESLNKSGLYQKLVAEQLLIPHQEVTEKSNGQKDSYKIIKPNLVPFISYPYEWSFSQLKNAALATLNIQKISLAHDMSLKDASAYNIQFYNGKPTLIDSLSFEVFNNEPWVAYKQFCQHFLAPLLLVAYKDIRLAQLSKVWIDGIPLDLTSQLLPLRTWFRFSIFSHIHLHAKLQKSNADKAQKPVSKKAFSKQSLLGMLDNLTSLVKSLEWKPEGTEWGDYYTNTNYTDSAFKNKADLVEKYIDAVRPKTVWDLGANNGEFSSIAAKRGIFTLAADIDPAAVEKNYLRCNKNSDKFMHPLIMDLTAPSPKIGWNNTERQDLFSRGPADLVLALALIHHLAISNNVPLEQIANFFSKTCSNLAIEFVPKSDSKVQILLSSRKDIFDKYDLENFKLEFSKYFNIKSADKIAGSERVLFLMENKKS